MSGARCSEDPKKDKDRFKPQGADPHARNSKQPALFTSWHLPRACVSLEPDASLRSTSVTRKLTRDLGAGTLPRERPRTCVGFGRQGWLVPAVGRRGSSWPLAGWQGRRAVLNGTWRRGHPLGAGHSQRDRLLGCAGGGREVGRSAFGILREKGQRQPGGLPPRCPSPAHRCSRSAVPASGPGAQLTKKSPGLEPGRCARRCARAARPRSALPASLAFPPSRRPLPKCEMQNLH